MRAAAVLLLCASLGCASKTVTPPRAPAPTLDAQALARGETPMILWALSQPHHEVSTLFGPHLLTISVQSKLSKDKEIVVDLREDISLSVDQDGVVHALSSNNQNEGFDAYATPDSAAIATRYGPLQPAPRKAVDQARDTALGSVHANLELLSPWLVLTPGEEEERSGKKGLLFTLSQKSAPAPEAIASDDKAWRATIKPELIAGELALDPQSGFLLFADVSLRYSATRNEQEILFEINLKANLDAQGEAVAAIKVPELFPLEPKLRVEKERLDIIGKAALQQQKESKKPKPKPAPKPAAPKAPAPPAGEGNPPPP